MGRPGPVTRPGDVGEGHGAAPAIGAVSTYRERLYRAYLSTHLGAFRPTTPATLERDRRLHRALYRRFLPTSPTAPILEVGCGTGSFLHFLRREGYRNAHGIDLGEEQVTAARSLGIQEVERAEALTYLDQHLGAYDLIVALDVLEHFTKDEVLAFLDRVYRALRPGGRVLLKTPNGDCPYVSWIRYGDFSHETVFTPLSVRQVLRACGFTEIKVVPLEPPVHGLPSAARRLLWQAFKAAIRLYLLAEQGVTGSGVFTSNLCAVAQRPPAGRSSLDGTCP